MTFVPAYVMVGQYFDKHRGKAMSLATMGSGAGNVFFAALIPLLFSAYGFSGMFFILGAIQLNHVVSASVYRPPHETATAKTVEEKPHDVPLVEAGANDVKDLKSVEEKNDSALLQSLHHLSALLTNVTFLTYAFVIVGMQFCLVVFLIFLPKLALETGARESQLWYTLLIFGVLDIAGRLAVGVVFDLKIFRQNRSRPFCAVSLLFGVFVACLTVAPSFQSVCVLTALVAIFEGAMHSQRTTVISEFVCSEQVSLAVGVVIFCQGIGNLTGPFIAGKLTDHLLTSRYGFVVGGVLLMTSSIVFFLTRSCRMSHQDT